MGPKEQLGDVMDQLKVAEPVYLCIINIYSNINIIIFPFVLHN